MILTGEIENELHEILYFVRNHKEKLSEEQKIKLSDMLISATEKVRDAYELKSAYYVTAEMNALTKRIEQLEKEGKINAY